MADSPPTMEQLAHSEMPRFGVGDYLRMARHRGLRLPFAYLRQAHWFDLKHGTDTHSWYPDVGYMVSWTSEIRKSLAWLQEAYGSDLERFQFLDPACGKGKPPLLYAMEMGCRWNLSPRYSPIGIDHSAGMVAIAQANCQKLASGLSLMPSFVHDNGLNFSRHVRSECILAYLYNPFEGDTLDRFIAALAGYKVILVYNYPVHVERFVEAGFRQVHGWDGFHPNAVTCILNNL